MSRFPMTLQNVTSDGVFVCSLPVPFACRILGVRVMDAAGVAADNTNYVDADITGTTGYDSRAANQGALTAGVALDLTLNRSVIIAAGGELKASFAKGGSGQACKMGITWLLEPAN